MDIDLLGLQIPRMKFHEIRNAARDPFFSNVYRDLKQNQQADKYHTRQDLQSHCPGGTALNDREDICG